jgi:CubicO group peptidase (beta-lactamase class C family)
MTEWTLESMRPRISELLQRPAISGVVIAVARDGHPVEHLAVGSDARGRPLTPDSLFPVASITKLVTALSVLRLVDPGDASRRELVGRPRTRRDRRGDPGCRQRSG